MTLSRYAAPVITFAALAGMCAVGMAAFAAHGLEARVTDGARALFLFKTATEFQMHHALALLAMVLVGERLEAGPARMVLRTGAGLMILGILLFPTALYSEALGGPHFFAPWGGMAAMGAWLLLAIAAILSLRKKRL